MTAEPNRTPPQVTAWRAATVAITLLILALIGLGVAGLGPLGPVLGTFFQYQAVTG